VLLVVAGFLVLTQLDRGGDGAVADKCEAATLESIAA
jgi:hypothetical protein